MVDGSTALQAQRDDSISRAANSAAKARTFRATIENCDQDALSRYGEMAIGGVAGHSQQALWVGSWAETVATDSFILTIFKNDKPILALPLEVEKAGPLRVARFMGGSHANANFPACAMGCEGLTADALAQTITAALASTRPDIDAIALEQQMHSLGGMTNPLATLPHQTSPNIALAVSLENGFDGVLAKHNGKRRRKKHRYQCRKFEEAGGYRIITAQTPEETRRLFAAYVDMKAIWFRKNRLPDVFEDEHIRGFFKHLFAQSLRQERPPYFMEALEVGGILRAVSGSSRVNGRVVCEFGGIAEDELTQFSPGEFLTFESIQTACCEGNRIYDYGVGDEHYKRLWCDQEIHHFDVVIPLTVKGRLYSGIKSALTALKRRVKSSPGLTRMVRRLRGQPVRETD
ncbi:MAG: GNAT family N-acetyltransferase [Rhizobiaceae bacterium]